MSTGAEGDSCIIGFSKVAPGSLTMAVFHKFRQDLSDLLEGPGGYGRLSVMVAGLVIGWWLYVPLHELLHAAGCWLGGGVVSRLEIQPLYGGRILSEMLPFVVAHGPYAGRLSGFDTGGSDWVYALTVGFPFTLTLAGFGLMGPAVGRRLPFLFGMALPLAFSPLISLTGDFLELGSLMLFQFWPGPEGIHRALISDDLFHLLEQLATLDTPPSRSLATVAFVSFSQLMGLAGAGALVALAGQLRRRV